MLRMLHTYPISPWTKYKPYLHPIYEIRYLIRDRQLTKFNIHCTSPPLLVLLRPPSLGRASVAAAPPKGLSTSLGSRGARSKMGAPELPSEARGADTTRIVGGRRASIRWRRQRRRWRSLVLGRVDSRTQLDLFELTQLLIRLAQLGLETRLACARAIAGARRAALRHGGLAPPVRRCSPSIDTWSGHRVASSKVEAAIAC